MNLIKKIWHDENSEPPKNYLWAKEGKLFKYVEGQWKEIYKKEDGGEEGGENEGDDVSGMKWYEKLATLSQLKPVAWAIASNNWANAEILNMDEFDEDYPTFADWFNDGNSRIYALYSSTINGPVLAYIDTKSYGKLSVGYDEGVGNWYEVSIDGETYCTVCRYV